MTHNAEILDDLREPTRSLRHEIPAAWAGFLALHEGAMTDGALPRHLKEATALAISVAQQCDGCIAHHAKAAAKAGASHAEVAELLAVALLMGGGTASVYAPRAWAAFEEFAGAAATAPPVA